MAKIYNYLNKVDEMYNKINDNEIVLIGRHGINIQAKYIQIRLGTSTVDNHAHFGGIQIIGCEDENLNDKVEDIQAQFPACCFSTCTPKDLLNQDNEGFVIGEHNPSTIEIKLTEPCKIGRIFFKFAEGHQYRLFEVNYSMDGKKWFSIDKNEAMLAPLDGIYHTDMSKFESENWLASIDPKTTLVTVEELSKILNGYVRKDEVDEYIRKAIYDMREVLLLDLNTNFKKKKRR